jgi:glycosyltransferase involved in cell wall biosynthesis
VSEIALIHYTAPPVVGGVERIVGRHASLMADAGHAVRIVAGRGAAQDPRVRFALVERADSLHPEAVAVSADLAVGRVTREFIALARGLEDDLAAALEGVDLAILHNVASLNRNLALTEALHACLGRPGAPRAILWHHDPAWTLPRYQPSLHEGKPWSLLRTAWPGAIQVTISASRRRDLAELMAIPEDSIAVVPGGVDLPGEALGSGAAPAADAGEEAVVVEEATGPTTPFDPLLLTPARLTPRKNIELAIETVAALRATGHQHAGLVVTGPVDPHDHTEWLYLERLLELRRRLGLDEAVVFLAQTVAGHPADERLDELYRSADAMLLPSWDEGFGLPMLEAAVYGLPIACSDLPSLRELAGDAATYIDPGAGGRAVAEAVLAAIVRGPSSELAERVLENYNWPAIYRLHLAPLLQRALPS